MQDLDPVPAQMRGEEQLFPGHARQAVAARQWHLHQANPARRLAGQHGRGLGTVVDHVLLLPVRPGEGVYQPPGPEAHAGVPATQHHGIDCYAHRPSRAIRARL